MAQLVKMKTPRYTHTFKDNRFLATVAAAFNKERTVFPINGAARLGIHT